MMWAPQRRKHKAEPVEGTELSPRQDVSCPYCDSAEVTTILSTLHVVRLM